ncbi:MAG: hypothetical protein M3O15_05970 [Acidobacteriota bacterium]|nr:hypothetical protein [Acidobacteriota bacterium]
MQKRQQTRPRKLVLNKETVSLIGNGSLVGVAGGISAASSCDVGDGKLECVLPTDGGSAAC